MTQKLWPDLKSVPYGNSHTLGKTPRWPFRETVTLTSAVTQYTAVIKFSVTQIHPASDQILTVKDDLHHDDNINLGFVRNVSFPAHESVLL